MHNRIRKIAVIPARGGSKRIPRKNIKDFLGKPIIAYSIEAALDSGIFDEVMVSTEDSEIADIAISYGASVPFQRSIKNSDDYATTVEVMIEVLEKYKNCNTPKFDWLCCIYPTSPLINSTKLIDSYETLLAHNGSSLIPVVRYSFPPQRAFVVKDGLLVYNQDEHSSTRSQDLEPYYHDAGQFYWVDTNIMLKIKSLVTNKTIPFILRETEVQDIDTLIDWTMAELKFKLAQSTSIVTK